MTGLRFVLALSLSGCVSVASGEEVADAGVAVGAKIVAGTAELLTLPTVSYATETSRIFVPGPLDLGTPSRAWECSHLPCADLSHFSRIYCLDGAGQLVTMRVESVAEAPRARKAGRTRRTGRSSR